MKLKKNITGSTTLVESCVMYEARDMWGQQGKKLCIRGRRWHVIRIIFITKIYVFREQFIFWVSFHKKVVNKVNV